MVSRGLEEVDRPRERMSRAGGGDDDGVAFGCWQWQLLGDKIVAKVDMNKRS